jgi:hypothetical protein
MQLQILQGLFGHGSQLLAAHRNYGASLGSLERACAIYPERKNVPFSRTCWGSTKTAAKICTGYSFRRRAAVISKKVG